MSKGAKLAKTVIGKDLSTFSLPVFLNEPTTILQKLAESYAIWSDYLVDAADEPDPIVRMQHIATYLAAIQWNVNGRTDKPFIALLGETYELITDKFKFVAECVKSNPCVLACNV